MEYLLQSKGLWIHAAGVPETTTTTSVAVGSPVKGKDPKGVIQDKGKEATWLIEDSKARGIIGLNVSTDLQPIIDGKFSAFEAWWAIHEYFERLSKSNKVVLQVQLFKAEMKEGESLLTYLNKIIRIRDNLRGLNLEVQEFMVCCKVISSLLPQYNAIAQTLMQTDDQILTLSYLRAQFALEDSRQILTPKNSEKISDSSALNANEKDKSQEKCHRCGRTGHYARECYAKIEAKNSDCGQGRGRGRGRGANVNEVKDQDLTFYSQTKSKSARVDKGWYLDSGSTSHMTNNPDFVINRVSCSREISGALPGKSIFATEMGTVELFPILDSGSKRVKLENVLVAPGIRKNLISVKQICKHGGIVNFSDCSAQVTLNGNVVMIAKLVANNLYRVELEVPKIEVHDAEVKSNIDLWHERSGHLSDQDAHTWKALFMGYAPERGAYDIQKKKIVFSKDVRCNEMRKFSEFGSENSGYNSESGHMDVFDGQENSERFKFSNEKTIQTSPINSERELLEGSKEGNEHHNGNALPKCCSTEEDSDNSSEVSKDEGVSNKETVYSKSGIHSSDTSAKFPKMEKETTPQTPMKSCSSIQKAKVAKTKGRTKLVMTFQEAQHHQQKRLHLRNRKLRKSRKFQKFRKFRKFRKLKFRIQRSTSSKQQLVAYWDSRKQLKDTAQMVAEALTKPLQRVKLSQHVADMGLH